MSQSAPPPAPSTRKPTRRPDPHHPGLAARRTAVLALCDVLIRHLPLDDSLDTQIQHANLPLRDSGLVRAMATVVIRHLGQLRAIIQSRLNADHLPAKVPDLELYLLIGAAQLIHLDVPDHAAVDITIRAARENPRILPYAKLINAVLRRIAREKDTLSPPLSPLINLPDWLSQRWINHYGESTARRLAQACGQEANLDLSVKSDPALWAETWQAHVLPNGSVRLQDRRPVTSLPGYTEGIFWVQDVAASLPAQLLKAQPHERVADLCAAPGGKTAQLAMTGAQILAVDRSAPRLQRLQENLKRLGLSVETKACDAATLQADPFDAILLDAPCSATGTLRRHPDVAWTKQERDILKLTQVQSRLLDHAISLLKPGGRLIYCTCSLESEEGEAQIKAALERHPHLTRDPFHPDEAVFPADALTPEGDVRTLPFMGFGDSAADQGMDGFFIARLRVRK